MSEARVLTKLVLWLAAGLLAGGGCSSLSKHHDRPGEDDTANKSLFNLDKFNEQVKKTGRTLVGKGENPEKARALYATAEGKYQEASHAEGAERKQLYLAAAKAFKDAADRWPDSAMEIDAMFLSGESFFFADQYPKANNQFEALLKKYPNSRYLDLIEARRFSIAEYWLKHHQDHPQPSLIANLTDRSRPVSTNSGTRSASTIASASTTPRASWRMTPPWPPPTPISPHTATWTRTISTPTCGRRSPTASTSSPPTTWA